MSKGIIFDIKEFSVNDGPGVRITIFMKGCPLRCKWCHNPEGLEKKPQYNNQTKKMVGVEYEVDDLIDRINLYHDFFAEFKGGVTFSGGEPTMQADFLKECACKLPDVHKLLDTSGYCEERTFSEVVKNFDMVYFDIKLIDDSEHKFYTGVSNEKILNNLKYLMSIEKETVIRIPMIPGITDTKKNLYLIAEQLGKECDRKTKIHLLPYNSLAGGKYPIYGMNYPLYNERKKNSIGNITEFNKKLNEMGFNVNNYVREE